jgi:hypothetical protein
LLFWESDIIHVAHAIESMTLIDRSLCSKEQYLVSVTLELLDYIHKEIVIYDEKIKAIYSLSKECFWMALARCVAQIIGNQVSGLVWGRCRGHQ